jgi:hypothetical protein
MRGYLICFSIKMRTSKGERCILMCLPIGFDIISAPESCDINQNLYIECILLRKVVHNMNYV